MQTVYKVDGNKYSVWQAPDDEIIVRPFTQIKPPQGDNIVLIGFNWADGKWEYVETVDVNDYQKLKDQVAKLLGGGN